MTVTSTRSFTMMIVLAAALPGCAQPVSAPAPEDPPAQTVPDQQPVQEPEVEGEEGRQIDLDVDVGVGDNGVQVDVGEDGVSVDADFNGVQVDIGDDDEQDR